MPTILQHHYVLAVPDLERSVAFYTDVLGFEVTARPDGWAFVTRDNCTIMLGHCPDDTPPGELGSHSYFAYLCVDDVDALHEQVVKHNVEIISKLGDRPWDMREFGLRTLAGHRIMIGQKIGS